MAIRLAAFCMLVTASALQVEFSPTAAGIEGESRVPGNQTLQLQAASKKRDNSTKVNETRLLDLIHEDPRFNPLEESVGDLSMADMLDMIEALGVAVKEGGFQQKVQAVIRDLGTRSAKFAQKAKEKAEQFKLEATDAYDEGFVTLMATYLNETLLLEQLHAAESLIGKNKIISYLPQGVKDQLKVIFAKMHASNFSLPDFTFESFNNTKLFDICDKVTPMSTAIAGFQHNLTQLNDLLNSTAQMLPMLADFMPDTPKAVVSFLQDMLDLAQNEMQVHENAIKDLTEIAVPVIQEKTGCEWSQACSRSSLGLFSILAAVVLGLFRGL